VEEGFCTLEASRDLIVNPVFSGGTRVMEPGGPGGLRLGTGRDLAGPPTCGARVEEEVVVVDSWCDLD
jgi:hypothetical protein